MYHSTKNSCNWNHDKYFSITSNKTNYSTSETNGSENSNFKCLEFTTSLTVSRKEEIKTISSARTVPATASTRLTTI